VAELSIATLHVPDNAPDVVAQTVRAPDTTLGNTVIVPLTHRGLPETLAAAAGAFETIVLPDNEPAPISIEKVSLPGPVTVPIEDNGSSAEVREHGPKDVADPHVAMTWWEVSPVVGVRFRLPVVIAHVNQLAPVAEQDDTAPPPPLPVCCVHVLADVQIYNCSVLVASVAINGSPTLHVAGKLAVAPRGKFKVMRFPHLFGDQHS